jgi:hypothetical protein
MIEQQFRVARIRTGLYGVYLAGPGDTLLGYVRGDYRAGFEALHPDREYVTRQTFPDPTTAAGLVFEDHRNRELAQAISKTAEAFGPVLVISADGVHEGTVEGNTIQMDDAS